MVNGQIAITNLHVGSKFAFFLKAENELLIAVFPTNNAESDKPG